MGGTRDGFEEIGRTGDGFEIGRADGLGAFR